MPKTATISASNPVCCRFHSSQTCCYHFILHRLLQNKGGFMFIGWQLFHTDVQHSNKHAPRQWLPVGMTCHDKHLHIIVSYRFKHFVALTNRFLCQQAVFVDSISASGFHIRSSHGSIQRSAATLGSILRSNAYGCHGPSSHFDRNDRICCRVARIQASWLRNPIHHCKYYCNNL